MRYILVLEDDKNIGEMMTMALNAFLDAEVVVHSTEAAAIEHIREHGAPTIALSDFYLGGGTTSTGFFDFIDKNHSNVNLFLVSATDPKILDPFCKEYGAGFIQKPFDLDDIIPKLRAKY